MFRYKFQFLFLAVFALAFVACDDDDTVVPVEEELITTATVTLTPQGGGDAVVLNWVDLDGDGGNAPVITGGTLAANTVYTGDIQVLNETENPAEDITEEIEEEDEEHQFFFSVSGGLNATTAYTDADADNNPIGLAFTLTTGDASSGDFTVILRHEPDKGAAGVKDGDITNAGGSTDVEAVYPVTIQ